MQSLHSEQDWPRSRAKLSSSSWSPPTTTRPCFRLNQPSLQIKAAYNHGVHRIESGIRQLTSPPPSDWDETASTATVRCRRLVRVAQAAAECTPQVTACARMPSLAEACGITH